MIAGAPGESRRAPKPWWRRCGPPAACRCRAARAAPTCSTPRSSAAPPRTASSSTTATPWLGASAAAPSCRRSLGVGYTQKPSGKALIEAIVAGYETVTAIGARLCIPICASAASIRPARSRLFGAAMATGKLRGLPAAQASTTRSASRPRARPACSPSSTAARDIKRLHAGHASREGLQAALLAEQGVEGPPNVIEARDGFMQAFAFGRADKARADRAAAGRAVRHHRLLHQAEPCCRHIQPAVEALIGLLNDEKIATDEVEHVEVETYRIAAEHAHTGWDDFASAQLSFPYLMARRALQIPRHQVRVFRRATRSRSGVRGVRRASSPSRRRPRSTGSIRGCGRRA